MHAARRRGQDVGLGEMGGLDGNPTSAFSYESLDFAWLLDPADSEKKTQIQISTLRCLALPHTPTGSLTKLLI